MLGGLFSVLAGVASAVLPASLETGDLATADVEEFVAFFNNAKLIIGIVSAFLGMIIAYAGFALIKKKKVGYTLGLILCILGCLTVNIISIIGLIFFLKKSVKDYHQ